MAVLNLRDQVQHQKMYWVFGSGAFQFYWSNLLLENSVGRYVHSKNCQESEILAKTLIFWFKMWIKLKFICDVTWRDVSCCCCCDAFRPGCKIIEINFAKTLYYPDCHFLKSECVTAIQTTLACGLRLLKAILTLKIFLATRWQHQLLAWPAFSPERFLNVDA